MFEKIVYTKLLYFKGYIIEVACLLYLTTHSLSLILLLFYQHYYTYKTYANKQ